MSKSKRLAGVAAAVALLTVTACTAEPPPSAATAVVAESGSMPVAATTAGGVTTPATPVAASRVWAPGMPANAATALRLYAAPDRAAMAMGEYPRGAQFTVVEPDGDFTTYPVVVEEVAWVRVRAEDGLVGWVYGVALEEE